MGKQLGVSILLSGQVGLSYGEKVGPDYYDREMLWSEKVGRGQSCFIVFILLYTVGINM